MTGNKMISRRRIIRGQQECGQQLGEQGSSSSSVQQASSASSSNKSAASSKSSGRQQQVQQAQMQQAAHPRGQQQQQQQQQQQAVSRGRQRLGPQGRGSGPKQAGERDRDRELEREERQPQQQDNSDGYTVNPYEDYADERQQAKDYWRQQDNMSGRPETRAGQGADYRNFDPYSIYSEEDDVWYSEERLFEVSFTAPTLGFTSSALLGPPGVGLFPAQAGSPFGRANEPRPHLLLKLMLIALARFRVKTRAAPSGVG